MKSLVFGLFLALNSHALGFFVEPGIFINLNGGSDVEFDDGTQTVDGVMRNEQLSYALKIGLISGRFEFGIEEEIYNLTAHLDTNGSGGDQAEDLVITYKSFFVGYEFIEKHFLYLAVSNSPYADFEGESFTEEQGAFSLEYAYHIQKEFSFNVKVETATKLESDSSPKKHLSYRNLVFAGFSIPISTAH